MFVAGTVTVAAGANGAGLAVPTAWAIAGAGPPAANQGIDGVVFAAAGSAVEASGLRSARAVGKAASSLPPLPPLSPLLPLLLPS